MRSFLDFGYNFIQSSIKYYMQGKHKTVTLCGSTRFKNEFFRVQKELTLMGVHCDFCGK